MRIIVMYQCLRDLVAFTLAKRGKGCILGQNAADRFKRRQAVRGNMKIFNYKRVPYAEIRAFSVHILTASGCFPRVSGCGRRRRTPLHRHVLVVGPCSGSSTASTGPSPVKVRVKEVLPNWSGDTLDNVIDYVTYVLLPAFALYQSGMIGEPWSFAAAGMIVVSSAIYYADMGMKTDGVFLLRFSGRLEYGRVYALRHRRKRYRQP